MEAKNFIKNRETIRKDFKNSVELINIKIITYFNTVYRPLQLRGKVLIQLIKTD
jgi:hypothetical protein